MSRLATVAMAGWLAVQATTARAQEMRRREGPPGQPAASGPITIPPVPQDPAHPFVGVWVGEFTGDGGGGFPLTVVVEFLNGAYAGYDAIGDVPRDIQRHLSDGVSGRTLRWEVPNPGTNMRTTIFTHTATLTARDSMIGTVTSRDTLHPGIAPAASGTFRLHRRRPSR